MTSHQNGTIVGRPDNMLKSFDLEISYQGGWVSLNDHVNFTASAEGFGVTQVTRRRETVTSPYYDGEFEVHSVRENVKETVGIYLTAPSQSQLTENILLLQACFEQSVYNIRKTLDEHREVWVCQSADWSLDRGHVNAHNCRATMSFEVPRLPQVQWEVVF